MAETTKGYLSLTHLVALYNFTGVDVSEPLQMKIGIMGGTFNPIHLAHLISAEQIRQRLSFDQILFIPSARPPHKPPDGIIDPEHRYRMTQLAIADNPHFSVSRIEVDRQGQSYAIKTFQELQANYGAGCELAWIIGADSLIEFKIWKDYDRLLNICRFIATTRPNYPLSTVPSEIIKRVDIFEIPEIEISATDIRQRIRSGQSIRYLVPPSVAAYIQKHHLYR